MEKTVTLTGGWSLVTDPENIGKQQSWACTPHAEAKEAPVPGTIQLVYPTYEGVLWYYHRIARLPQTGKDDRLLLSFGNVDYFCDVYLDGAWIGSHEGANAPFSFDVTGKAAEGSLLAVRLIVPKWDEPIDGLKLIEVPHSNKGGGEYPIGGQYNYGGIYEPVELKAVPAVRIEDVFVKADIHTGLARFLVTVQNDTGAPADCQLRVNVFQGAEESPRKWEEMTILAPAGQSETEISLTIENPLLWDTVSPNLYRASLLLTSQAGHQSRYSFRYGYRECKVEKGFFYLNGRRIFLKSTHTGNTFPITGGGTVPAQLPEIEFKDFQLLKASGFNCIRYIATMPTRKQLEYCDALGLMVYEESFASWFLDLACNERTKDYFNQTWEATIKRDRNHPSVVIWGLLNETWKTAAHEAAVAILPTLRTWDDTRLVLLSSGKFVKDFTLGCLANPGVSEWEHQWGDDGTGLSAEEGQIGDYHTYPRYPHGDSGVWMFKEYCKGKKPAFISEYGVASLLDVETACRNFECYGADPLAPDRRIIERIRKKYEEAFYRYGMDRMYAEPVDFLRESERYNAKSRRDGFDLIRANPRFCGYNMTGCLDHAISGEGPITLFRSFKKDNYDTFADGWADLRWSLFTGKGHLYSGETQTLEAVLANIGVLPDGEYTAHFAVVNEYGMPIWKHETTFTLPQIAEDGLPSLTVPVMKETAVLTGKPGKYLFRAYLVQGGSPAAYEKEFFLSEKPTDMLNKTIGGIGVPKEAIEFLAAHGVTVSDDLEGCDTILVGSLFSGTVEGENARNRWWDPTINWHKTVAAQTKENGERVMALCKAGKKVIFGESFYLHNHDDDHPNDFLSFFERPDLDIFLSPDWLYHKDSAILPHPYTEGVKPGFLDWDWYWGCVPVDTIVTQAEADCAAAFFYVGGPIWCKPYNEMLAGHLLAEFTHGEGSFVLSALPILQNPGNSPAGDRILLNLLQ